MGMSDDYYDFHCGNDPRLVKIAIINDNFHTITIRANVAKTIDFSGGTRKVETIRLNKCFKATRIIWPDRTGAIRRLYIHHADTLTNLDLSALTSLEELSILNCRSLEKITGLSDSIKEINIHNVKLNSLDVSHLQQLQKINLVTSANNVTLDLSSLKQLQIASLSANKFTPENKLHSQINLSKCESLHTMYIDTGDNLLDLDISDDHGLTEAVILCGKTSKLAGLQDCTELEFFHAPQRMEMNEVSSTLAKKFKPGNPVEKLEAMMSMNQEFYALARHNKAGIHDRETVIQEIGSQVEVDKANAAKIMLLGTPLDIEIAMNRKDLSKELRQVMIDNTYFPPAPLSPLYYFPTMAASGYVPEETSLGIPATRIINKQNPVKTIAAWLENPEGLIPNLLLIEQNALNNPEVIKFLKQFRNNPVNVAHENKLYQLRPYDKIIVRGDWYRIKNRIPAIGGLINQIPRAALAAPVGGGMLAGADAINAYYNMLIESSTLLTQRMMETNRTLSHRSRNIQTLRQAAEIKRLAREFFYYLEQVLPAHAARLRSPDDQTPVHGRSTVPDEPVEINAKAEKRTRPEPDEQTLVGGAAKHARTTPDEQILVQGGAQRTPRPEPDDQTLIQGGAQRTPRPQPDDQTLIQGGAQRKPRPEPDDQTLVHGEANRKPRPEPDDQTLVHGEANRKPRPEPDDQTLVHGEANRKPRPEPDDQTLVHGEANRKPRPEPDDQTLVHGEASRKPRPEPDDQTLVDGGAQSMPRPQPDDQTLIDANADLPADMKPRQASQYPIDKTSVGKGLENVPPMSATPTMQRLLDQSKKLADEINKFKKRAGDLPEQVLIDAESILPADVKSKVALQTPIDTKHQAHGLAAAPPLNPDPAQQNILEAARKLADAVKNMTNNTTGIPEQILIDADALAPATKGLASVPSLTPENNNQRLLETVKKLANSIKKMTDNASGIPEQILVHAESASPSDLAPQPALLLAAAKKLAIDVETMLKNTDGLPEQVLIHAEKLHHATSVTNELKLLEASRNLAHAMKNMTAAACALDTAKASPSAKAAAVLVDTSIKEFKKDVNNISLLDSANVFIIGMKLFAKACTDELPFSNKQEVYQGKTPELRSSIFKILQNAHRQYVKDNDLLNPGANLFGRTPGKKEMRAEILARFLDAIINVNNLKPEVVDREFAKLIKDTELKYALGGIEVELKECLTGIKRPEPALAPKLELKDGD